MIRCRPRAAMPRRPLPFQRAGHDDHRVGRVGGPPAQPITPCGALTSTARGLTLPAGTSEVTEVPDLEPVTQEIAQAAAMQIIRNRTEYDVAVIGSGAGGGM